MLADAEDAETAQLAKCIRDRKLPACIDIRQRVEQELPLIEGEPRTTRLAQVKLFCSNIATTLKGSSLAEPRGPTRIFLDGYDRPPYKRY